MTFVVKRLSQTLRARLGGGGHFAVRHPRFSRFALAQTSPAGIVPDGRIFAFNGIFKGRPAILAHVFGSHPTPTSYTLPFTIRPAKGTYGTILTASLPQVTSHWGYVTGIQMTLGRSFRSHGRAQSYLSASCPAPASFPGATFPFARASFAFAGGWRLSSTLTRSCRVRG
jgi:hypothetical protein